MDSSNQHINIGTRGSLLAMTQTRMVQAAIVEHYPEITVTLQEIKTLGCRKQGTAQASQTDKKDWVVDLEEALLAGEIDLAIHSGKDIPADIAAGTALLPLLPRATPLDAFVGRLDKNTGQRGRFSDLPKGAKIGTASLRRRAELLRLRPDIHVIEHRGNVPTRINKMDESEDIAGIILACAGIERLNLLPAATYETFSADHMLPSINQGTLVGQFRADDLALAKALTALVTPSQQPIFLAERAVAIVLEGDCKSAMSIYAQMIDNVLHIASRVLSPDGKDCVEGHLSGEPSDAHALGTQLAHQLIEQGAADIIRQASLTTVWQS